MPTQPAKIDPITIIVGDRAFTPMRFQSPMPQPPPAMTEALPGDDNSDKKSDKSKTSSSSSSSNSKDKKTGLGKITSAITSKFQKSPEEQGEQRKHKHFPQLANEKLIGQDYRCELVTLNGDVHGYLQFTINHLLFIPDQGTDIGIPFCEILTVARLILAEAMNDAPPQFIAVEKPDIKFHAFEVFLSSGQLLIFKNFIVKKDAAPDTQLTYEAFNVLDHMWHSCATVPAPDYSFIPLAEYPQPQIAYTPAPKVTVITTKQAIIQADVHEDKQQSDKKDQQKSNLERNPEQPKEAHSDKDNDKDANKDANKDKDQDKDKDADKHKQ